MSPTLAKVSDFVSRKLVRLSEHAESRILSNGIKYREVLAGLSSAVIVED